MLKGVAFYLSKLVVPFWLGPDYGRAPEWVLAQWWHWFTGLVPWGLALWLWSRRTRVPWLVAAVGVFVTGLLPVLGLVPFAFQAYSTVADHYMYSAMLGPALALAWGLGFYLQHRHAESIRRLPQRDSRQGRQGQDFRLR